MMTAGIDIGSRTIKTAVLDGEKIIRLDVVDATSSALESARSLIKDLPSCPLVATGYGRDLLDAVLETPTITEIKAHAIGARFLCNDCSTVIDIGGQDIKVITLDSRGRVYRFEMNDRCAAGSGRFLEIMADRLGFSLEEFSAAAVQGMDGVTISSVCTVFAESEVVGLLNRNIPGKNIARALHNTIAKRISAMYKRVDPDSSRVVLTGGGAKNRALHGFLEKSLGVKITVSPNSQYAGAIGCAIFAAQSKL